MKTCEKCNITVEDKDSKQYYSTRLCEDCYIDELMPKMIKSHYKNQSEFMNRLKDSYITHPQQYH